ncbi:MAG: hypothetical protein GXP46_01765 [Deferribacteres bacterium]|nr:hypothetical protein [Deferribacteres bacterium]
MINLGDKVKDIVTGFEGVVTCRCEYLNGCVRVEVQLDKLKDGKPIGSLWIDTQQLIVVKAGKVNIKSVKNDDPPGGPGSIPTSFSQPD